MNLSKLGRNLSVLVAAALSWALLFTATGHAAGPQNWLHPAGAVAKLQLELFQLTLWIMVGVFVVVSGILVYTIIRFRGRRQQAATSTPSAAAQSETAAAGDKRGVEPELPPQIEGNNTLEIIWTAIPVILLLIMAVPTVQISYSLAAPPAEEEPLDVRVVAHQWWWEFEYPEFGIVTANEMHIPVNRPVQVTLESNDVVHKFWVPRLAGKLDAIPGRVNQKWLQADEEGVFYGQCAELCGASHALMRFRVIAQSEEDFNNWVTGWGAQTPVARSEAEADAFARGQDLFISKGCNACHSIEGTTAQGQIGPNLTGFGNRITVAAGIMDNTPENLGRWLANPPEVKPGSLMPDLGLSDQEVADLVTYLHSLN